MDLRFRDGRTDRRGARRRRRAPRRAVLRLGRRRPRPSSTCAAARARPGRRATGATCCCPPSTRSTTRRGWIGEGALDYICRRLTVPPAEGPTRWRPSTRCSRSSPAGRGCSTSAPTWPARPRAPRRSAATSRSASALRRLVAAEPLPWACASAPRPPWRSKPAIPPPTPSTGRARWARRGPTSRRNLRSRRRCRRRSPGRRRAMSPSPWSCSSASASSILSLDDYRATGGYTGLRRAFELGPSGVIREVLESGLVGRGGAAFPTGAQVGGDRTPARPSPLPRLQRRRERAGHVQGPGRRWRATRSP